MSEHVCFAYLKNCNCIFIKSGNKRVGKTMKSIGNFGKTMSAFDRVLAFRRDSSNLLKVICRMMFLFTK